MKNLLIAFLVLGSISAIAGNHSDKREVEFNFCQINLQAIEESKSLIEKNLENGVICQEEANARLAIQSLAQENVEITCKKLIGKRSLRDIKKENF